MLAWLTADRPQPRSADAPRTRIIDLLANPALRAVYIAGFSLLFALVAGFTYVSLRLGEAPFNFGPGALSAIFVVYLASIFTTPFSGRLLNRYGHSRVLAVAWGTAIVGLLITIPASLPAVIVGLILFSGGLFFAQTAATTFVGEAMPRARGAAVGLYVTSYRSEEHTSELQSLMRISYAVFCLKKKQTYTTKVYAPQTRIQ